MRSTILTLRDNFRFIIWAVFDPLFSMSLSSFVTTSFEPRCITLESAIWFMLKSSSLERNMRKIGYSANSFLSKLILITPARRLYYHRCLSVWWCHHESLWIDCVKGDLSRYNIEEGLALDRSQWRAATRRPDLPWGVTRMMMMMVVVVVWWWP